MKIWNKMIHALAISALFFCTAIPVFAEEVEGENGWNVIFDGNDSLVNNVETKDEFTEKLSKLQPGDVVYLTVSIGNTSDKETDWYMKNEVLNSFEKSVKASGGAYSYQLSYVDQDGAANIIYDSDTVGGDKVINNLEGLEQATNSLTDYFYLNTLSPNESGKVMLRIGLDGETNGNAYQNAAADLEMIFAVEYSASNVPNEPKKEVHTEVKYVTVKNQKTSAVNTGDESNVTLYAILSVVGLSGFISLFILRKRKVKRK